MEPPIKAFNWGHKPIQLEFDDGIGIEFRPVQIHLKEDGALNNSPSLCIVFHHPSVNSYVYGQMSLEMFNGALKELGYKIVPDVQVNP